MTNQAVTVSIEVAAAPLLAFEVFTSEIDAWWLRGPSHRFRPPWNGKLSFEPGPSGCLLETYADGKTFVIGRVSRWLPGERIVLSWRLPSFSGSESTEVDVRFDAIPSGTRVSVEHRGWDRLRADHPARHGKQGREYAYMRASLWAESLSALRAHIQRNSTPGSRRITRNER